MNKNRGYIKEGVMFVLAILAIFALFILYTIFSSKSEPIRYLASQGNVDGLVKNAEAKPAEPPVRIVTHVQTPVNGVKSVYMSSWVAGTPIMRSKIIKMIEETELNAVVIDVKDSTGLISFEVSDPYLKQFDTVENRIGDVENLIDILHSKNIYVIARIAAFQDPKLVKIKPEWAVLKKSNDKAWGDRKGMTWIDPGCKEAWNYLIALGSEAYKIGFDELNFDYIRFPSDGDMSDIKYRFYDGTITKAEQMRLFFEYLSMALDSTGAPLSADLFGMTMTNTDDLNIGQVLENTLPYFDYVSPMVYPSHYPTGFHNYKNPATVPYEIIRISMDEGVKRTIAASSTPNKLRPWLQDFDMGAVYTADMVRAQMKATYDSGLNSWMLWDPSNKYTPEALLKNGELVKTN